MAWSTAIIRELERYALDPIDDKRLGGPTAFRALLRTAHARRWEVLNELDDLDRAINAATTAFAHHESTAVEPSAENKENHRAAEIREAFRQIREARALFTGPLTDAPTAAAAPSPVNNHGAGGPPRPTAKIDVVASVDAKSFKRLEECLEAIGQRLTHASERLAKLEAVKAAPLATKRRPASKAKPKAK